MTFLGADISAFLSVAMSQSHQAAQSSRAGRMWSAKGMRRSSPA